MTHIPDARLVEAARRGDVSGLSELCQRHYASMVGIAYSVLSDHHLAEDAAQETFAIACRDLGRLKRPARFAGWLSVICRNVAKSMAKRRTGSVVAEDVPARADDDPGRRTDEIVWRCVGQLPASEREVLVLRYFSGLTCEQIAATLEISGQAVYGRLKRGKRRMAEHLSRNGLGRKVS